MVFPLKPPFSYGFPMVSHGFPMVSWGVHFLSLVAPRGTMAAAAGSWRSLQGRSRHRPPGIARRAAGEFSEATCQSWYY